MTKHPCTAECRAFDHDENPVVRRVAAMRAGVSLAACVAAMTALAFSATM